MLNTQMSPSEPPLELVPTSAGYFLFFFLTFQHLASRPPSTSSRGPVLPPRVFAETTSDIPLQQVCHPDCDIHSGNVSDDLQYYDNPSKSITCRTAEDCVDSDPKKPIHDWGNSYMVVKGGD